MQKQPPPIYAVKIIGGARHVVGSGHWDENDNLVVGTDISEEDARMFVRMGFAEETASRETFRQALLPPPAPIDLFKRDA